MLYFLQTSCLVGLCTHVQMIPIARQVRVSKVKVAICVSIALFHFFRNILWNIVLFAQHRVIVDYSEGDVLKQLLLSF